MIVKAVRVFRGEFLRYELQVSREKVTKFINKMSLPPAFGKNAGQKRKLHNIGEAAYREFAGYPQWERRILSRALFEKYQEHIKKEGNDV